MKTLITTLCAAALALSASAASAADKEIAVIVKTVNSDFWQNVKKGANKYELGEQLREDIRRFSETNGCDRMVMVWCGSTEVFMRPGDAHQTVEAFEVEQVARRLSPSPSKASQAAERSA